MKGFLLAVDDFKSIQIVISSIFSQDFDVVRKPNGKEALAWLFEGNIPDLIITDLQMPEMCGFEFISNLKSNQVFKGVPIVVLSGKDDSSERIKCYKLGVNEFITKPFSPEELRIRCLNLLERNPSALPH
ncbi:response regulator [Cytophagaceae bacterium ABcell3]|nr:response regulator [Cytophagaceae bacterium ABcell3]